MSQKPSLPQSPDSVQQALMPNTVSRRPLVAGKSRDYGDLHPRSERHPEFPKWGPMKATATMSDLPAQSSLDEVMRWVREELDSRHPKPVAALTAAPTNTKTLAHRLKDEIESPATGPLTTTMSPVETASGALKRDSSPRAIVAEQWKHSPTMRVALLTTSAGQAGTGGAERLYDMLEVALKSSDVVVERTEIVVEEGDFDSILRSYLRSYDLDLSGFDGVISTKAPTYAARHRNHVSYLIHTMRVFYDMFDDTFPDPTPAQLAQRVIIHKIDTAAMQRASLRGRFAVGREVAERLRIFNGVDSEVLHHPTSLQGLHDGAFSHLLLPGRLHRWKRVDLALEAVRRMRHRVDLIVSGAGDDERRLRELAGGMIGVHFVGHLNDPDLVELYADALAVLYCPIREDYGLVPVEAFLSGTPVVTCADSGEAARLVRDGVNGFVCAPNPDAIAARLDWLLDNRGQAGEMGRRGREAVAHITWDNVCRRLLAALRQPPGVN
jgi:glycosyltransferase involved in cell wall biosynthesis